MAKECHGILSFRQSYCPIPSLFHALFLLPTPVAVVGHGSNWNLIVPISSVLPLFATTYSPISLCALKCSFSDVGKPPATACLSRKDCSGCSAVTPRVRAGEFGSDLASHSKWWEAKCLRVMHLHISFWMRSIIFITHLDYAGTMFRGQSRTCSLWCVYLTRWASST